MEFVSTFLGMGDLNLPWVGWGIWTRTVKSFQQNTCGCSRYGDWSLKEKKLLLIANGWETEGCKSSAAFLKVCIKTRVYWSCVILSLVFTSNRVVVGVVIRSIELYDLLKIKLTESEAEHWFYLWFRCLRSSKNCIVWVASRSGRINQWKYLTPGLGIGWFFHFCFWLRQPSFHWIISNGVIKGIRRNGHVLIIPTVISSSLWLR